jgi:hypothetical protein
MISVLETAVGLKKCKGGIEPCAFAEGTVSASLSLSGKEAPFTFNSWSVSENWAMSKAQFPRTRLLSDQVNSDSRRKLFWFIASKWSLLQKITSQALPSPAFSVINR